MGRVFFLEQKTRLTCVIRVQLCSSWRIRVRDCGLEPLELEHGRREHRDVGVFLGMVRDGRGQVVPAVDGAEHLADARDAVGGHRRGFETPVVHLVEQRDRLDAAAREGQHRTRRTADVVDLFLNALNVLPVGLARLEEGLHVLGIEGAEIAVESGQDGPIGQRGGPGIERPPVDTVAQAELVLLLGEGQVEFVEVGAESFGQRADDLLDGLRILGVEALGNARQGHPAIANDAPEIGPPPVELGADGGLGLLGLLEDLRVDEGDLEPVGLRVDADTADLAGVDPLEFRGEAGVDLEGLDLELILLSLGHVQSLPFPEECCPRYAAIPGYLGSAALRPPVTRSLPLARQLGSGPLRTKKSLPEGKDFCPDVWFGYQTSRHKLE